MENGRAIAGVALILVPLIGAFLLADVIRRHGDEIGEARFDTATWTAGSADFPLPLPPLGARGPGREVHLMESRHG